MPTAKEMKDWEPIQRLEHWIIEREKIRLARKKNQKRPWTSDPILQNYRFCNVRRMDDKVSMWLLKNWYEPHFNHPLMLPAVALARFVNNPESLALITEIVFSDVWRPHEIGEALRAYRDEGGTVFNGAYMVRGNDGQDKISSVLDFYVNSLFVAHGHDPGHHLTRSSMEKTHANINACYGFGSFMAGQIVADLRWAVEGTWADRHTWAPIGPGSKRGMNRLLKQDLNAKLSQEVFLDALTELRISLKHSLRSSLSPGWLSKLECHDYQNCLCEFDKYERVLWGEGKPKQKYNGRGT